MSHEELSVNKIVPNFWHIEKNALESRISYRKKNLNSRGEGMLIPKMTRFQNYLTRIHSFDKHNWIWLFQNESYEVGTSNLTWQSGVFSLNTAKIKLSLDIFYSEFWSRTSNMPTKTTAAMQIAHAHTRNAWSTCGREVENLCVV